MAEYVIKLTVVVEPEVDARELQGGLNHPDTLKRLSNAVATGLTLKSVRTGEKYPEAGTFAVFSVTVDKK